MREIKFEIMFKVYTKDFDTRIEKHYTTLDRLVSGKDPVHTYEKDSIIAKRLYTGLKDVNGVELYQKDICKVIGIGVAVVDICPYYGVVFRKCGIEYPVIWCSTLISKCSAIMSDSALKSEKKQYEKIGNEFENPELIEES